MQLPPLAIGPTVPAGAAQRSASRAVALLDHVTAGAVRAGYGGLLTHAIADGTAAAKAAKAAVGG